MNDRNRSYYARPGAQNPVKPPLPPQDDSVTALPATLSAAMAYVPMQMDTAVYDEDKALVEGTLYPVLNKPFAGMGDRR